MLRSVVDVGFESQSTKCLLDALAVPHYIMSAYTPEQTTVKRGHCGQNACCASGRHYTFGQRKTLYMSAV